MKIPTMIECLELLKTARVPPHIVAHSTQVARCAVALARHLNGTGRPLNEALLWAGGLLHDIAKEISLKTGENHARLGAALLEQWGFGAVAPIVRDHIELEPSMLEEPFSESLVVNYADKRVKHDEIVTLDVRFADLVARYGKTPERKAFLERRWALYHMLERKLFAHTPISPERLADEARKVPRPSAGGHDGTTA
uniref:HDIG domain-containing protein n=1 Tax=Desulfacinum infernum TaxID=35837 RepID=A0A832A1L8_9BACT